MARKYKQVHRKEITFELSDWEKIKRRADACHTDTTKYLRTLILEKQPVFYDMKEIAPLINGMRIISRNINQIAKEANETNNIYAEDIETLRKEVSDLSHTVNLSLSTLLSRKV
ncbi:MAG: plasmid mobilization relaxosome protein MobC [Ruminococcus sp.]|nr:plasmid mobilization relaxosome protein MobC [Ruminococcus sp.]